MELVWPSPEHLPGYVDALERGWSPNTVRPEAGREDLAKIAADAGAFLTGLVDRHGSGPPIVLPDGTTAPRLPGYRRWIWDGGFCGSIGFRWQPDTHELPSYCLGHVGYSVVPWKQRRGYATRALALLLQDIRDESLALDHVELTTATTNVPSRRVIEANGGVLVERFMVPPELGRGEHFRFRIPLRQGRS